MKRGGGLCVLLTDGRGQFSIVNLPPGTYNVTFNSRSSHA